MPPVRRGRPAVEERVLADLRSIRAGVTGVHGSLAATIDGMLVAHDLPDADPAQVAAVVSSTFALASRATVLTGRGQFREAVTRGNDGYLAVYAAGRNAIVAVIGTSTLNVGLLQYQARAVIERVASYSDEFRKWSAPAERARPAQRGSAGPSGSVRSPGPARSAGSPGSGGSGGSAGDGAAPVPLPVRRPTARRGN
jgi:uncharacterized protein